MTDPVLVVTPEALADRAGITLTESARAVMVDAILDAQADVTAYLGRPITPVRVTETGRWGWTVGWDLEQVGDEPYITVVSAVAEVDSNNYPTGYFTVTYDMGLDTVNDPELRPIVRYVRAHALNSPEVTRLWRTVTGGSGEIRSLSAEGQSVSFGPTTLGGGGNAGSGAPGALPTLSSLDRWRIAGRRVYQATTRFGLREGW